MVWGEGPGMVWVECRGWRPPGVALTLEKIGHTVDWHRWSPGTEDRHKPRAYKDAD